MTTLDTFVPSTWVKENVDLPKVFELTNASIEANPDEAAHCIGLIAPAALGNYLINRLFDVLGIKHPKLKKREHLLDYLDDIERCWQYVAEEITAARMSDDKLRYVAGEYACDWGTDGGDFSLWFYRDTEQCANCGEDVVDFVELEIDGDDEWWCRKCASR